MSRGFSILTHLYIELNLASSEIYDSFEIIF